MDLTINAIGVIGLIILLVAFIVNVQKKAKCDFVWYNLMQLIGAGLLCIYAYLTNSQIFFVLEGVWVIVALYFLYNTIIVSKKNKTKSKNKKIKK